MKPIALPTLPAGVTSRARDEVWQPRSSHLTSEWADNGPLNFSLLCRGPPLLSPAACRRLRDSARLMPLRAYFGPPHHHQGCHPTSTPSRGAIRETSVGVDRDKGSGVSASEWKKRMLDQYCGGNGCFLALPGHFIRSRAFVSPHHLRIDGGLSSLSSELRAQFFQLKSAGIRIVVFLSHHQYARLWNPRGKPPGCPYACHDMFPRPQTQPLIHPSPFPSDLRAWLSFLPTGWQAPYDQSYSIGGGSFVVPWD